MTDSAAAVPDPRGGSNALNATHQSDGDVSSQDGSNPKVTNRRKLWVLRGLVFVLPLVVIIAAVAGNAAMGALAPEPEEKEDAIKALPVLTNAARTGSTTLKVTAQGEVTPRTEINVVSQVGGRIVYMSPNFIEGGRIRRGELLARIEPTEYELRVTQARAGISQAETILSRERSEAEQARRDWDELGRGGEPTPLTLREPQLAEAAAMLESAKASLAEAELQLSRTEIRARFDGRVAERNVDAGEFVSMNTPLGRVYSTQIMDVRLPLTQTEMRQIGINLGYEAKGEAGIPVKLSSGFAGDATWTGHIVRTDSLFDAQSRVLYVYAEVQDPFGTNAAEDTSTTPLAPGLFVEAEIDGQTLDNIILIPREALRGNDTVYVANDDDTLSVRTVSVRSSNRNEAILTGGLRAGERVVTSPIRGAADGMTIEVVDPNAADTETQEG